MSNYWNQFFKDPSFMGALIGALITGAIAIIIMNWTNITNRKEEKKKALNEFLKESRFLLYSVEGLIRYTNTYVKYQKEEESIKRTNTGPEPNSEMSEIQYAKRLNESDIASFLNKVKNVDRNKFTRDTFDIYLQILSITEGQVEYFWKRSLEIDVGGVGDILEEAIKELISLKNTLEQKYDEKEKKYSSL